MMKDTWDTCMHKNARKRDNVHSTNENLEFSVSYV